MESIFRAAFMYLFLMFIIRISGTRTLKEMTTFDFVLLLVIGDASQQAITSNDYSVINAVVIITTFVVMDFALSFLKNKFKKIDQILDGSPILLVNNGKLIKKMMHYTQIEETEILESGRKAHGLETLAEIKYAVLEKDGDITIIPFKKSS